jgi:putative acetyltransferase
VQVTNLLYGSSDMPGFEIREETREDGGAVFDVEEAAFGQSAQAHLVDALRRASDPQISLVAEQDGRIVGHIFFSPVSFEDLSLSHGCQLSPLAVVPGLQRTGIGSALIRKGLTACSSIGWTAVFLLGDPRYYSRFGFEMAANRELVHSGQDGEYLQYLETESDALRAVTGEVRFHPVFEAFE